ncbi:MAG: uncharacterized protein PWQ70_2541 [Clostridiales bacterium]|jgi:predicted aldo/keto reductase-like oxidoreductase|nr:uncharacterized protein [Clostridiales bacterium]
MKKNVLGRTGIEVTELCFGALPMGPLQKNLSVEECTELLVAALDGGINFIDTAQVYRTYDPIRKALKKVQNRPVIATKSMATSYEEMQKAVDEALEAMDIAYIDIFHLHAPKAETNVLEERKGAFQCLLDNKEKGKIRAVGISTHSVPVTALAAEVEEIDVVFPIINMYGRGIIQGTADEMKDAIGVCISKGKGVYFMKALAGGSLVGHYHDAMSYVRSIPGYTSIALGMVSLQEVAFNIKYFSTETFNMDSLPTFKTFKKQFRILHRQCKACGTCMSICPNEAIIEEGGKFYIQDQNCLQCGYCVGECPEFAIRII